MCENASSWEEEEDELCSGLLATCSGNILSQTSQCFVPGRTWLEVLQIEQLCTERCLSSRHDGGILSPLLVRVAEVGTSGCRRMQSTFQAHILCVCTVRAALFLTSSFHPNLKKKKKKLPALFNGRGEQTIWLLLPVSCLLFSLIQLHAAVHSWLLCPFNMICGRE